MDGCHIEEGLALAEKDSYQTLSSKSRLDILKLLYKKELSVEEIADSLNLHSITIRHHLQSLEEAGLIEKYDERDGTAGRPKTYYRIVKKTKIQGFPKRRYLTLSSFLIDALSFTAGEKNTKKILSRVGNAMGADVIKDLERKNDIKEWNPKEYLEFFIKKYLEESGAEPEVIEFTDKKIVYRLHNCLFFELGLKMPDKMCDVLHDTFHDGTSKAMAKSVKTTRLTCMGKGDDYCEHVCEWIDSTTEKNSSLPIP